jgi:hypothetical protein
VVLVVPVTLCAVLVLQETARQVRRLVRRGAHGHARKTTHGPARSWAAEKASQTVAIKTRPSRGTLTAAQEVLSTYELLEQILGELPSTTCEPTPERASSSKQYELPLSSVPGASGTKDLLFAQQVCKTWRDVIVDSPLIQQLLFFVPSRAGMVAYLEFKLDLLNAYDTLQLGPDLLPPSGNRWQCEAPTPYPTHWGRTRYDAGQ